GNGYVEDFPLARRYREQPVLAVWEGSGNVIVLDVLRAMGKDPRSAKQLLIFFESALGQNAIYDAHYQSFATETRQDLAAVTSQDASAGAQLQQRGRVLVERLAVTAQAPGRFSHGPAEITERFIRARLSRQRGRQQGALPDGVATDAPIARA